METPPFSKEKENTMKHIILLLTSLVLCCQDECVPESTQCSGDTIQICNSEKNWYSATDCTLVNPGLWECCENAMEYEGQKLTLCVPIDSCESDGGTDL